jgi:aminoglycoside phosphotransferase (APT) family kinase protein
VVVTIARNGVDWDHLATWAADVGLGDGPISDVEQLSGGTQNILIRFNLGDSTYVLRRPPVNKRAQSDLTMVREAKVLTALGNTAVPHPRLVASCEDLGVMGAAFFLMEAVDGVVATGVLPAGYLRDPSWMRAIGFEAIDVLAAIGNVNYQEAGLSELGKPDGFLERQVGRWRQQLESYAAVDGYDSASLSSVEQIAEWLQCNQPRGSAPGLIHGDYHLANMMCAYNAPRLVAIVDWELATIGDPLLDLGGMVATWPGQGPNELMAVAAPGLPTRAELIVRYSEQSTRDLSAFAWYEVLASFRLAIILEGTYVRAKAGLVSMSLGDRLHGNALHLLKRAEVAIRDS